MNQCRRVDSGDREGTMQLVAACSFDGESERRKGLRFKEGATGSGQLKMWVSTKEDALFRLQSEKTAWSVQTRRTFNC